jgi:hypothetical protein
MVKQLALYFALFMALVACRSNNKEVYQAPIFSVLTDTQTGLHFQNKLTPTPNYNMFNYMYFYNGAGIGARDYNNDGKID